MPLPTNNNLQMIMTAMKHALTMVGVEDAEKNNKMIDYIENVLVQFSGHQVQISKCKKPKAAGTVYYFYITFTVHLFTCFTCFLRLESTITERSHLMEYRRPMVDRGTKWCLINHPAVQPERMCMRKTWERLD